MIPQSFIEELRAQADIETVISSYVQLKRHGKILVGLCPFHSEKTGSFTVYPDTQSFYCFGCGAGGDVIGFIRRIENLDYVEAVKLLAERCGMTVPEDVREDRTALLKTKILEMNREAARFFHEQLVNTPEGKDPLGYLLGRGLLPGTIKHFGLGYAPASWDSLTKHLYSKGYAYEEMEAAQLARRGRNGGYYDVFRDRVMFPIIDLRGNVIAFGGRKRSGDGPKYYNSPETPVFNKTKNLFALNFAKKEKDLKYLIMCEGYMDVIAMHQAGFTNAVASLGTSLTTDQCKLASQYVSNVVLAYDNDDAGKKATNRAIKLLDEAGLRSKVLSIPKTPDVKDPDEYIKKNGAAMFRKIVEESKGSTEYELSLITSKYDTETMEGKIQALKESVELISTLSNAMERELWAQKLASQYEMSKEGILSQINDRIKRRARGESRKTPPVGGTSLRTNAVVPEKARNLSTAVAEERMIGILLRYPEESERVEGIIGAGDFSCELYGKFFERILSFRKAGYEVTLGTFNEGFTLEQQDAAARIWNASREQNFSHEDAVPMAEKIKEQKNRKSDSEIGSLEDDELNRYIEKIRKGKM